MKKLEIEISKGQPFSGLQRHGKIDAPVRHFLKENVQVEIVDADLIFRGIECKKEIAKKSYKITVIVEET